MLSRQFLSPTFALSSPADSALPAPRQGQDSWFGLVTGLGAYSLWGVIPLYFTLLRVYIEQLSFEVLAHRAVWSFVLLCAVVAAFGKLPLAWEAVTQRRSLVALAVSSLLIGGNWLAYIYAVQTEQIVQASLGYFITPLANALLGRMILGEQMKRLQVVALGFALAGVLVLTIRAGVLPWIALSLAFTFSLYGLMRKIMPADSLVGLFVETMLLSPAALAYLLWLHAEGTGIFCEAGPRELFLILSGPVTCAPLLLFATAARNLRMVTLGFLQFLAPTIQFLVAVYLLREPFRPEQVLAFSLIWIAVLIYIADSALRARISRAEAAG